MDGRAQLDELIYELHEVNQELATADLPLQRLEELDLDERKKLADQIRAGLKRWESVRQKIAETVNGSNKGINKG